MLERIFSVWLAEAQLLPELAYTRVLGDHAPHQWFYDGTEHVDPAKEANAQATRLKSNTTTLAAEYARQGKDWEAELHQRAKEKQLMRRLGLTEENADPAHPDHDEEIDTDVELSYAA